MTLPATHKASRIILATPRAIFRALLDPETVPAWRAQRGMIARVEHFNARPGGAYRLVLEYSLDNPGKGKSGSNTYIVDGKFVEILPDERIIEAVRFETEDSRFQGVVTVTTTLEPVKDGTKVSLRAQDVPFEINETDLREGMDATLKSLANIVE
ncbi:MAG: SRPBCC domain-containing protein [Sphingopyxis sp.]|nr:SRPBCC domain-containing protein [Sphingopyxis sp.]